MVAAAPHIVYVAPGHGRGKATRAAAIARHITVDLTVVVDAPEFVEPLRRFGVAHAQIPMARSAHDVDGAVKDLAPDLVVLDWDRPIHPPSPVVHIYRYGRRRLPVPTITVESQPAPGCADGWPILLLEDHETLTREAARTDLGLDPEQAVRFVVPSAAAPGAVERYSHVTQSRQSEDYIVEGLWPLSSWLRAADSVLGAPGLNLWSEVHHLAVPAAWCPVRPEQATRLSMDATPRTGLPNAAARAAAFIEGHLP